MINGKNGCLGVQEMMVGIRGEVNRYGGINNIDESLEILGSGVIVRFTP